MNDAPISIQIIGVGAVFTSMLFITFVTAWTMLDILTFNLN